ncbi:LPD7 domain-containing protein [Alloyangia pacifica]|uniref:LPD7 domain-containing protein n=1 Tax=Alloyangia pacifica TaxID=311180 RepID=UPI001CFDAB60|nr:LPD7 domain-containing protein [Alloyangia pacifica]
MAEKQNEVGFTLSYAGNDTVARFATAAEAGRAFADADAAQQPRVIEAVGQGARTLASTVTIGTNVQKSVPALDSLSEVSTKEFGSKSGEGFGETDLDFWTAYHERVAEQKREDTVKSPEPEVAATARENQGAGTIAPDEATKSRAGEDRFSLPASYHDRFLVTKAAHQQDLYRSYEDARPAISDTGDRLSTRNADRGTAMDMIELAAHRGWQNLTARGPEEFRREMWIEGTAQGLKVQGYRPSEKDREEASRRAQMLGERVLERAEGEQIVRGGSTAGVSRPDGPAKDGNVVRMPRANFAEGITGTITEIGSAPYRNREGADPVPFIELTREGGKAERLWSVTLPDAVEKHDLKVGDQVTLYSPGVEPVTYKTVDKKSGEEVERQGHRRLWDARDIQRAAEVNRGAPDAVEAQPQEKSAAEAEGKNTVSEKPREQEMSSERLEDRIKHYEPGDQAVKGPASVLAHMDARMRAGGVSEEDREAARANVAKLLSQGLQAGRSVQVQSLANVFREQERLVQNAGQVAEKERGRGGQKGQER